MLKIIIGGVVGAVVGFFIYRYVGCRSGACMITSNPYTSTIYWALLGGLIANII